MKIESLKIKGFQCFDHDSEPIDFHEELTTLIGANGTGKTSCFNALLRLFGSTQAQRSIRKSDFHIPRPNNELISGTKLEIDVVFNLSKTCKDKLPFFRKVFIEENLMGMQSWKLRAVLRAKWTDDGTVDGSIDSELKWIKTLSKRFKWNDGVKVTGPERGIVQIVYIPATRDAESEVSNFLNSRLWKAVLWSKNLEKNVRANTKKIQKEFERETAVKKIENTIRKKWKSLDTINMKSIPKLQLENKSLEKFVKQVGFEFLPISRNWKRDLIEMSDGQKSLFHIILTTTILEIEWDLLRYSGNNSFNIDKLKYAHLTILIIEEPENYLAPFYLPRIISHVQEIGEMPIGQVFLSSHSPAIMSRVKPENVRFFRFKEEKNSVKINKIKLPQGDEKAEKYVRLTILAYPEIFFARFVVLGEGESERIVLNRIASASKIVLDSSFIPIVPIGNRYAKNFWNLLNDLGIPHATILDLDLGRFHGGINTIIQVAKWLEDGGTKWSKNYIYKSNKLRIGNLKKIKTNRNVSNSNWVWFEVLREERVFFSHPLDLDYAMLTAFSKKYRDSRKNGSGPRKNILNSKEEVLKRGGDYSLYDSTHDTNIIWYPYLFLRRSKLETHILALSDISDNYLKKNMPKEIKYLIEEIKRYI